MCLGFYCSPYRSVACVLGLLVRHLPMQLQSESDLDHVSFLCVSILNAYTCLGVAGRLVVPLSMACVRLLRVATLAMSSYAFGWWDCAGIAPSVTLGSQARHVYVYMVYGYTFCACSVFPIESAHVTLKLGVVLTGARRHVHFAEHMFACDC
jgi:hypothetical protein